MKQIPLILFAGTTEGRLLAQELAAGGVPLLVCVATQYGAELLRPQRNLQVRQGRMDAEQMAELFEQAECSLVVDATHPYAKEVSKNICAACKAKQAKYLRLVRGAWDDKNVVTASGMAEAAVILARDGGRALLTVGSKELAAFTAVPAYREKIFARVLPSAAVVEACHSLGFQGSRLICMQGPFSHELNVAMLRQTEAEWLVTKESGEAGGFYEKLSAAEVAGVKLLLVRRPQTETGLGYEEMRSLLSGELGCYLNAKKNAVEDEEGAPRFPMFVSLTGKTAVVVGGGKIAQRRIQTLRACGAAIVVIAPEITTELTQWIKSEKVAWHQRVYRQGELALLDAALAVAVTDSRDVNRQVGLDAASAGIPCSVADAPDEGSFWFPALIRGEHVVAGMVSTNGDHGAVRLAATELRQSWEGVNENDQNRQ